MPPIDIDSLTPVDQMDHLALSREFMELQQDVIRSNEIEAKEREGLPINESEREFLATIPAKMRRACEITGASESSLVGACVEALVNYVESHGEITLPIMVVPKSALTEPRALSILKESEPRDEAVI